MANRSSLSQLRDIFDRRITASDIAEPLMALSEAKSAKQARELMAARAYDVVGIHRNGRVFGYAHYDDLLEGTLGENAKEFAISDLVTDTTGLQKVLVRLRDRPWIFVLDDEHVASIVTTADLQKGPVRLWLFGLVTLIEMHFARMIRHICGDDSWKKTARDYLQDAEQTFQRLRSRNEEIDLIDCLSFSGKRSVVVQNRQLREIIGFDSYEAAQSSLRRIVDFRNDLAHAHDFGSGRWPEIIEAVNDAERILDRCEEHLKRFQ